MTTYRLMMLILGALAGVLIILAWMLYWLGAMYFTLRKGLNELIEGLATIDARLDRLGKRNDEETS